MALFLNVIKANLSQSVQRTQRNDILLLPVWGGNKKQARPGPKIIKNCFCDHYLKPEKKLMYHCIQKPEQVNQFLCDLWEYECYKKKIKTGRSFGLIFCQPTNQMNQINDLESSVCTAIRTSPGYAVASQSPGVFIKAPAADLKTAGADPAKFLSFPAAMAMKGSGRSSFFFGFGWHLGVCRMEDGFHSRLDVRCWMFNMKTRPNPMSL